MCFAIQAHIGFVTLGPSSGPESVDCRTNSSTSIRCTWGDVPYLDQNGIIVGYKVCHSPSLIKTPPHYLANQWNKRYILYHLINHHYLKDIHLIFIALQVHYQDKSSASLEPDVLTVVGNETKSVLIVDLRKYVSYEIQVLAYTRMGDGVLSQPPVEQKTLDDSMLSKQQQSKALLE